MMRLTPILCAVIAPAASIVTRTPAVHAQDDYIAYWSFDEGEGAIAHDASPNVLDGTLYGAAWTDGVRGGALSFDGVDDYLDMTGQPGDTGFLSTIPFGKISVWFRFESACPTDEIHPIFYFGGAQGSAIGPPSLIVEVGHYSNGPTKLYFTIVPPGGIPTQCYDSTFNLALHRWYHFAAVVGPGYNTGYLDGEEMTSRHYNFGGPNLDEFFDDVTLQQACWVGKGFLSMRPQTQFLDGAVDELRIYDRPLTAEEIADHHQCLTTGPNGDVTGDLIVGSQDVLAVLAAWGTCVGCPEDLNFDGDVDFADLLEVLWGWGESCV